MKNKETFLLIKLMTLLVILTFTGCTGGSSPTPEPTHELPTATLTIKPTATSTVEPTATATTTPMPVPTNLIDIPPLLTPVSTLSASEVEATLLGLYETKSNIDCRLPCWWGFIPGQTKWEEIEQTLTLLGSEIYLYNFENNMSIAEVEIFISDGGSIGQMYTINNGVLEMIEVIVSFRNPTYSVSSFFNSYGHPSEVRLDTYGYIREGGLPFNLLVFYPDQGLLIRYDVEATEENNIVYGCPQNKPALVIAVWDPNQELTFDEALEKTFQIDNLKEYKLLEEVTDMNVETFFDTFVNPDTKTCIETPSEFWNSN